MLLAQSLPVDGDGACFSFLLLQQAGCGIHFSRDLYFQAQLLDNSLEKNSSTDLTRLREQHNDGDSPELRHPCDWRNK